MLTSKKLLNQRKNSLGELLTCARCLRGLTQLELAKRVGIHQSSLSRIEKGILVPGVYLWHRIVQALDIPMDYVKNMFIDLQQIAKTQDNLINEFCKIPPKYTENSCLKYYSLKASKTV